MKNEFGRHKRDMCVDYSNTVNMYTKLDAYLLPESETLVSELVNYQVFSTFDQKSAYYQVSLCENDKPFIAFEPGVYTSLLEYRLG